MLARFSCNGMVLTKWQKIACFFSGVGGLYGTLFTFGSLHEKYSHKLNNFIDWIDTIVPTVFTKKSYEISPTSHKPNRLIKVCDYIQESNLFKPIKRVCFTLVGKTIFFF